MVQVTSGHCALFLVKHFSSKVHSKVHNLDQVCKQCRGAASFDAADPGVKSRPFGQLHKLEGFYFQVIFDYHFSGP